MLEKIICIVFIIGLHPVASTVVNSCSTGLKPEVNITNCNVPPCDIKLGTSEGFNMSFRAPCYLENAAPYVIARTFIPLPFPLPQKNICEGVTNTPCPLAKNEYVEYHFEMLISKWVPSNFGLTLEFGIKDNDQHDKVVVCFNFDAKTVK